MCNLKWRGLVLCVSRTGTFLIFHIKERLKWQSNLQLPYKLINEQTMVYIAENIGSKSLWSVLWPHRSDKIYKYPLEMIHDSALLFLTSIIARFYARDSKTFKAFFIFQCIRCTGEEPLLSLWNKIPWTAICTYLWTRSLFEKIGWLNIFSRHFGFYLFEDPYKMLDAQTYKCLL